MERALKRRYILSVIVRFTVYLNFITEFYLIITSLFTTSVFRVLLIILDARVKLIAKRFGHRYNSTHNPYATGCLREGCE